MEGRHGRNQGRKEGEALAEEEAEEEMGKKVRYRGWGGGRGRYYSVHIVPKARKRGKRQGYVLIPVIVSWYT